LTRSVRFSCSDDANVAIITVNSNDRMDRAAVHIFELGSGGEIATKENAGLATGAYPLVSSAEGHTRLVETTVDGLHQSARFSLWNVDTGKLIVESPPLAMLHHSCAFGIGIGSCTPYDERPQLRLSQSGKVVLAYWETGGKPMMRFSLR
jgi:hypothetical protein